MHRPQQESGVLGLGNLLSFRPPTSLDQSQSAPGYNGGDSAPPQGDCIESVRYRTQHATHSSISETSALSLSLFQANTGRHFLSFLGTLGRERGPGAEQMTRLGRRWDIAGQPARSGSPGKPGLTVTLGRNTGGTPLRVVWGCGVL